MHRFGIDWSGGGEFTAKSMPSASDASRDSPRVTLRTLATAAGVSVQAVSLALRNQSKVAPQTRARIQALARKLGYKPDPVLVRLMHHLRGNQARRVGVNVCFLTTISPKTQNIFYQRVASGAGEVAHDAGFSHELMHLDRAKISGDRLLRLLRARGVDGLVLLPMADLRPLDDLLGWKDFSVVAATLSVPSPQFDRAVADHFSNMFTIAERLQAFGFRRPGLVIGRPHDKRCDYRLSAAMAWHGSFGKFEVVTVHRFDPPLDWRSLSRWLRSEKPDVLIAPSEEIAVELRQHGGTTAKLPVVGFTIPEKGPSPFSGCDEKPERIGAVAMEILARKLAMGQRGVALNPSTTMVPGEWVTGLDLAGLDSRCR